VAGYWALALGDCDPGTGIRGAPVVPGHRPPLGQCGIGIDQGTAAGDSCPYRHN